jgi:small-conductance mechanosensitive channel
MTSGPADEPVPPPGGQASASSHAETGSAVPDDPQQLEEKIAQTREQLGETVEQLVAKTDVKARAQAKAADLTQRAKDTADQVRQQAASVGGAGREQLQSRASEAGAPLWAAAPDPLKRAVAKGTEGARQHRKPLAIAAGVLIIGAVVIRWWTRR